MKDEKSNSIKRVFVCGAGHQGLSMAAHLALNGVKVTLWNRNIANIVKIVENRKIYCSGVINGTVRIERASDDLSEVISDFVMVTVPSNAHREIAQRLAPYVHKDMIIVLNPGRTFGAIDFHMTLQECGVKEFPQIAETQTIIYTCRKSNADHVVIYALKNNVRIAALRNSNIMYIMDKMPDCLKKYLKIENSVAVTSFSNVGMVLHCSPIMMNIGWIETEKTDFKYYYEGISRSIANFLEKIDKERVDVAKGAGVDVASVSDWLKETYHVVGNNLYECIQNNLFYKEIDAPKTIHCRYILEDVPNGLVPVEFLGEQMGIHTPNMTMIINLANIVLNKNFRKEGRQFSYNILQKNF